MKVEFSYILALFLVVASCKRFEVDVDGGVDHGLLRAQARLDPAPSSPTGDVLVKNRSSVDLKFQIGDKTSTISSGDDLLFVGVEDFTKFVASVLQRDGRWSPMATGTVAPESGSEILTFTDG
ncbi:hypothetical protein [Haloferula sp. A504]|uniref:hypothetical protein n=1 Tax=Haloferula sp. A504 TaxID=3373601 RepID=UPI0031C04637|nr:hypothetical protein [Verrucomicrobiaceae bacterium E54]